MTFPGFTAVYEASKDEEEGERNSPLPDLTEGEPLSMAELDRGQHFTQPPARYTEASLIRTLEEKGIGRPSTYAPTISTILDREYVVKEGKALRPTPLGEVVTGLMKDKFSRRGGPRLHRPDGGEAGRGGSGQESTGRIVLSAVLRRLQGRTGAGRDRTLDGERIKVPDEVSDEVCDLCGKTDGHQVRPVRPLPGLSRLAGVYLYQAPGHRNAGQVPQVRRPHPEKDQPGTGTPTTAVSTTRHL